MCMLVIYRFLYFYFYEMIGKIIKIGVPFSFLFYGGRGVWWGGSGINELNFQLVQN